jgi:hypothetical protein
MVGQLLHHRFMQRDVLICRPIRSNVDAQFVGQLLACAQAGVEVHKLDAADRGDHQHQHHRADSRRLASYESAKHLARV